MPLKITCPSCRTPFTVPETLRGKKIRCKKCEETFVVGEKAAAAGRHSADPDDGIQEKSRPVVTRARPRPLEDMDEPRQRPRRKTPVRQPSRGLLIALIGGGAALVLVLGLSVAGALMFRPSTSQPPEGNLLSQGIPRAQFLPQPAEPVEPAPLPGGGHNPIGRSGTLRYRWQGGPHVYAVRVEAEASDHWEIREGNCIVEARPRSRSPRPAGPPEERKGSGTGFVVNANGYLLTCAHVVEDAVKLEAVLGGRSYPAKVLALDQNHDLALIQIEAQNLAPLTLGNSDNAEVGQEVRALGFPLSSLLGDNLKATRGTLSGVNVEKGVRVFQVDASVNPGNSGGPLVGETGEVLGVAIAKLAGEAISNVAFATPSNEAKRLLASKGVAPAAGAWTTKLDGPTLVKRISPSVALIKVTLNPSAESAAFQLTCSGRLVKRQQPKEGMAFRPLPPVFEFPDPFAPTSSRLEVDDTGNILNASGGNQLPFLLGDLGMFLIEPFPDDPRSSWETKNICTIQESKDNSRQSPFGRFGPMGPGFRPPAPPRPPFGPVGPRFGPSGPPFGPMGPRFGPSGPPFGPPGAPFGAPREQPEEEQTTTRQGTEHSLYTLGARGGITVVINKKYEMIIPSGAGDSPSLNMTGDSQIAFDFKNGLPRTINFKATLTLARGNASHRLPLTVSYTLLEGKDRERVLKPPSPPQTEPKPNAPPKPKEEPGPRVESKPFTDADLEPILADLKGADRRKRKGALGRLPTAALGARRAEVAQALEPILAENDFFTRKACLQALGNWGTRDNVPAMLKFLDDPSPFIRWETMSALAKLQDERAIEPIAKHLVNFHDRGKASQALQTLGAQAEKTVVFYLKHNDWGVRLEACKILKLIGTRQSKAPLEEAARDSNGLVANEAKNAVQVVSARP